MGNAQNCIVSDEERELLLASNWSERDIRKIYKKFINLDKDKNGQLDIQELSSIPGLADNPIVKRVIAIFDKDMDGKISFTEFLIGLSKFTVGADETEKLKFAFDIYDTEKDGNISNGELFKVMKMMVGNNLNDQQLQQLVDRAIIEADKDGDGMISYSEFEEMVAHINFKEKLSLNL